MAAALSLWLLPLCARYWLLTLCSLRCLCQAIAFPWSQRKPTLQYWCRRLQRSREGSEHSPSTSTTAGSSSQTGPNLSASWQLGQSQVVAPSCGLPRPPLLPAPAATPPIPAPPPAPVLKCWLALGPQAMAWQRQRREHSVSSHGSSSHRHEAAAMKRGHDYSSYPRTLHIDPAGSKFPPTGGPSSRTHFPTTVAERSVRRETRRWMKAMPVSD
ncbi:hypothetical protein XELAEV_18025024mg [Xenopus laevis]|uniref:Secreted protein n=1 Tax=Xenopus laevis TaxID=8355 RepID=A0A974CZ55_XENLA|nr:hypothetical protein XELAEV_18025024mg [Xenopus laevis]